MTKDGRVLVFDLDDTLYLERDFARSGFAAAGAWLKARTGLDGLAERCNALFDAGSRTRIFDEAIAAMDLGGDDALVPALIDVYRAHTPDISLAIDALQYLHQSGERSRRAIITDGPAATQKAKVAALRLETMVDLVVYTDSWGRDYWKPHPLAYETVQEWAGVAPSHIVYIADNPLKDFVTPRRLGWMTVQIQRSERVHRVDAPSPAHDAHARIDDLNALDACLSVLSPSSIT